MKTIYSAPNITFVRMFQNLLEEQGINCWVKNEFITAAVGEIPPIECWPELCVNEEDFSQAKRLVDEALSEKVGPAWKCDTCGEEIEGQFSECWNCGKSRPLGLNAS